MLHQWTRNVKAIGLGLLTMAGAASAQTPDVPGPIDSLEDLQDTGRMVFKVLDANNDGQISQKEAIDAGNLGVGGLFFAADVDGNGIVTQDEAKQAREAFLSQRPLLRFMIERTKNVGSQPNNGTPNPAAAIGSLLDANNDKQLQATEVRQAVQTAVQGIFATADTNRDGLMSPVEVNAAIAGAVKAAQQASFQAADSDNNGQISKEEFQKSLTDPANAAFQVLDANADGQLSQQELQRAGQVIENQLKRSMLPEPPNSARNLLKSGQKPEEVAPVPNIAVPNRSATAPAPR
ncbi:EF-hand domain-containing protein [Tundrisphaera lichenicola]|uniref:EF-hand domain-containing protein n=1 Tax=Tundrisphaera lichenicola TaxID=2029860 RepID=UPI003EB864B6